MVITIVVIEVIAVVFDVVIVNCSNVNGFF